jgi:O-antigen ligase
MLGNANYAGMVAAVGATLGVCLALKIKRLSLHLAILAGTVVLLVALVISGSRGSMAGFAVGAIATLILAKTWRVLLVVVATGIVGLILTLTVAQGLFDRVGMSDITSGRTELWDVLLAHWRDRPIFGTGYRTIEVLSGMGGYSAHDIFLWMLTELGLVGLVMFLGFLVTMAITGKLNVFLGSALCVLVVELTESTLFGWGGPAALTFWLVLLAYPAFARSVAVEDQPQALNDQPEISLPAGTSPNVS